MRRLDHGWAGGPALWANVSEHCDVLIDTIPERHKVVRRATAENMECICCLPGLSATNKSTSAIYSSADGG